MESKFPVGSSAKIILGLFTSALAIATLCCCPPDNSAGVCEALSESPTCLSTSWDLSKAETLSLPAYFSGSIMLSNAEFLASK